MQDIRSSFRDEEHPQSWLRSPVSVCAPSLAPTRKEHRIPLSGCTPFYHISKKCRHYSLFRRSLSPFFAPLQLLRSASSAPALMSRSTPGRSCARSRQSSSSFSGDASLLGGTLNSSRSSAVISILLFLIPSDIKRHYLTGSQA